MPGIDIRRLAQAQITPALFAGFERHQEVRRCWRKEDGRWVLKDIAFTERWDEKEYEELVRCLQRTARTGGEVLGALEGGRLVGFCSVEPQRFGPSGEYVALSSLHVSEGRRGRGEGRRLFAGAVYAAERLGARKLYISAHSSEETQAFYRAMGCVEAEHYDAKLHEKEPCDCQMECCLHPWVRQAGRSDADAVTDLALLLWPGHEREALKAELLAYRDEGVIFLAFEAGEPVGFAQCGLRRDYVEGAHTSPVGYLEGIYVSEGLRRRGVARAMLRTCERWAKERACAEFASDCALENAQSLAFHLGSGFMEANRIICFTKKL